MGIQPFRDGDTFATFRALVEGTVREIDALDNEYVLKASPTELEKYYVSKVTIVPLSLDSANYHIEDQQPTQLDVSHEFDRFAPRGERSIVKGTTLNIAIPYSGDRNLWWIRPSTFTLSQHPVIEIRNDVVVFGCTFVDDSVNADRLKSEIQRNVNSLGDAVENLRRDVENHNRTAPQTIQSSS